MTCCCIKGQYDCFFDYKSHNEVMYTDVSLWTTDADIYYDVSVTSLFNNEIKSYEVSNTTSTHLRDFFTRDGIYKCDVESCNSTYTKHCFIYPNIQCVLDNLLLKDDYDCFLKLTKYIEYIKANIRNENIESAEFYFDKLQRDLKNINCEGCSVCY